MKDPKIMTPKDIELLARRSAAISRLEHQAGITRKSLFWNKAPQSERPRDFSPIAAQRRSDRMLHNAISNLDCDTIDRALRMGADVHSTIDGMTLTRRLEIERGKVPPRGAPFDPQNHQHDVQMEKITAMVSLLRAHGAKL
ncbi:MAG: hypothetical protein PHV13_04260 [Candidatus ainarchaeum sp.]|nr:hypothetical protein [Candidatus ainarchaeum sp.]